MQKLHEVLHVTYGNDLSHLADALVEELFAVSSLPFENRIIVVPSMAMKRFLIDQFIAHPRLKMVAGVRILPLGQAVMDVLMELSKEIPQKKIPSSLELSLVIGEKLTSPFFAKFSDLENYLNAGGKEKRERRISLLSEEIARLFIRYGLYGKQFLPSWLSSEGWQQALWQEIFTQEGGWTYPLEILKTSEAKQFEGKVALFGFSFLPTAHLHFFSAMGASLYCVSPCALFWEDQISEKQQLFIRRALQAKGVKESVQKEVASYDQQTHPLLGNWGRLGREMVKSLGSFATEENEAYREWEGDTLLARLKQSLLILDETETLTADDSIQIHTASSKMREVEVLRDAIETLMHAKAKSQSPLLPHEILVVCPNLADYAPYIAMVFGASSLPFAVEGMPLMQGSELLQGFLQLLKLPEERYALSSVFKLLRTASFMEKWELNPEEVHRVHEWCKQAQIRRDLKGSANSWEEGLDRLLHGLAAVPDEKKEFKIWPIPCIPQSEVELLNRFLKVFAHIQSDLAALHVSKTFGVWCEMFLSWVDKYFIVEWEKEPFFLELRALRLTCKELKEEKSFAEMERMMEKLAQKSNAEPHTSHVQKILFSPLEEGNLVPSKVIWCLGMQEGGFPRSEQPNALCEMKKVKSGDFIPQKAEEDRALFLELLLHAKEYLVFSYLRIDAEDGKHQEPCLLMDELHDYLERRGVTEGLKKFDHPMLPFDQAYFQTDASVKKWSSIDYLAAKAYYTSSQEERPFFTLKKSEVSIESSLVVDIRQLKKLARHPIQFYFNETLKMYLSEEEEGEETEFLISHLRKAVLRKNSLRSTVAHVLQRTRAEGKLPHGLFQEAAVQEIEEEMEDLFNEISLFKIKPEEITTHLFSSACRENERSAHVSPPLTLSLESGLTVHVVGVLEDISPQGLLYHGDKEVKSLMKVWPLYLIYRCLFEGPLLLTKKGEMLNFPHLQPKQALARYLEYYLCALQTPSPLMPDWAEALLEGDSDALKKAIGKETDDIYLNYLKRREGLFTADEAFTLWKEHAGKLGTLDEVKNGI